MKTRSAWRTVATWARIDSRVTSRRSWPSIRTRPDLGVDQPGDQADEGVLRVLVQAHDRGPRAGRESRPSRRRAGLGPSGSSRSRSRRRSRSAQRRQELGATAWLELGLASRNSKMPPPSGWPGGSLARIWIHCRLGWTRRDSERDQDERRGRRESGPRQRRCSRAGRGP